MNNYLSKKVLSPKQTQLNASITLNKEYIWKNIYKIEELKKQDSLRKSQNLCKSLQIRQ